MPLGAASEQPATRELYERRLTEVADRKRSVLLRSSGGGGPGGLAITQALNALPNTSLLGYITRVNGGHGTNTTPIGQVAVGGVRAITVLQQSSGLLGHVILTPSPCPAKNYPSRR
jgi:hypothetical protein